MDKKLVWQELTRILTSLFGPIMKERIDRYYERGQIDELIKLADHMLSGYMGEENANNLLKKIVK